MRSTVSLAATLCVAALAAGCGEEPTGTLIVNYQIGQPDETCAQHGVYEVRVVLRAPEEGDFETTARCQDGRAALTVNAVPVGVYSASVEGIDPNEDVLYEGFEAGLSITEGVATETNLIRLRPVPASLHVEWVFANGRMCPQNNVENIEVGYYFGGFYESVIATCIDGEVVIEDLLDGTYDVRVRAIDAETEEYTYAVDIDGVELSAGTETFLDYQTVVLEPCPTDCVP